MNYIKRLEAERKEEAAELVGIKAGLSDLITYLNSPKFYNDTTVQITDVLRRIEDAKDQGDRLRIEQEGMR